jgi:LmbE family N-acetylglucosaminyl deacetylase
MKNIIKKLDLVIAHPDDEIIFGFGVIKQAKRIICCVNDLNPNLPKSTSWHRSWKNRKFALEEVGRLLGVEIINLGYNSDFSNLPSEEITKLSDKINVLIKDEEVIFTHNQWGEYGHPDHILVHDIIKKSGKKILTSNIMLDSNFTGFRIYQVPEPENYRIVTNDLDLYNKCKSIYKQCKCWTWGGEIIKSTKIYIEK